MNQVQFTKSIVPFSRVLLDKKVLTFVSHTTGSSPIALIKKARSLLWKINSCSKHEGLTNVCKRLKESHRHYLLTGNTKFFSKKFFCGPGISIEASKILMSVHRMMYGPIDFSIETIRYPRTNPKKFFNKYQKELDLIANSGLLKFPVSLMGDYKVTHKHLNTTNEGFRYLGNLCNDIRIDTNRRTGGREFPIRVTLTGSANGSTLDSQIKDLKILLKPENKSLFNSNKLMWWLFKKNLVISSTLKEAIEKVKDENLCLSRLHALQDKSCKTRVVAILDTFSQISLRPIHFLLDAVTDRILNDFTYSHAGGVEYLKKQNGPFYSYDIKSATDTIPVEIGLWALKSVLKGWRSDDFSNWHASRIVKATERLLIHRDFRVGSSSETVRYTVGQPMGAYASFPMLALSQHILVHLSGVITYGKVKYLRYAVVGDDLVICDKEVALKYEELARELSIPINMTKTIISENSFEFCSRIVVDKQIVSPVSLKSFYSSLTTSDPYPLLKVMMEYGKVLPTYSLLCRYFPRKIIRNMIALTGIKLQGAPSSIVMIPGDVKAHAERVLQVLRLPPKKEKRKVSSPDNPYLERLNYGREISQIFIDRVDKNKKRLGMTVWHTCHTITANTFYLGYLDTYFNRKKLRSVPYRAYSKDRITRSEKIRQLCMAYRNQWYVINPIYKIGFTKGPA